MSGKLLQLLYYVVIAFAVGTLAQVITGYNKRRLFTTMVLGFIGVVIGDYLARLLKINLWLNVFGISLPWAIIGAVLFIVAYRLIRGRW